jgi:hypothetical protein
MTNDERMTEPEARSVHRDRDVVSIIRHSDFFRISDFGFRISLVIRSRTAGSFVISFPVCHALAIR